MTSPPDGPRPPVKAAKGTERRAELARLGARTGISYARHRVERLFTPHEKRTRLDEKFQLRTAADVADALGNMKGALMKVGQLASYVDEGLPEAFRVALADLQQDAPGMSPELAADVIQAELGAAPDRVFARWEETPFAAASIGQVHRALTDDGVEVAVKVQYPGVDHAIRSDLANAGLLFGMLGRMFPGIDSGPIVEEIRSRLLEELDYEIEADNQRLFAREYAGHPFIRVPGVVDGLSTARVLTTELDKGVRFEEMEQWSQADRDRAAEVIFRFVLGSIHRLHVFNGDPHPGNYLFHRGGPVTFLDFGLVKRFRAEEVAVIQGLVKAMVVDDDMARFRAIAEDAGFLARGAPFDDGLVGRYFGHFFQYLVDDEPSTFTPEFASKTVRRLFDAKGPYAEIMKVGNAPAFAVVLQRINVGLFAILGRLRATANWRAIAEEQWPFADRPPSTELGRLDDEWRRARS